MQPRFAAVLIMLALALVPAVLAGGSAANDVSVSFHMETESTDNPKMIFPQETNGQTRYFRRVSEVGAKDVLSFSPFPADAGGEFGVVFRLKENAARRLAAVTSANQGRYLIAKLNGRVVDGVLIDKQVDDGLVVIWKGVTLADIAILDDGLPRIGQEGAKKKKKK
ncbi:MAG: hypothetical protein Q8Q59_02155 [Luteolibacter sp.]|jgi:hypothetical protein|nr:hypothetical protein [Luteolibacter sp.]